MAAIYNASGGDTPKAIEKFCKETGCQPKTAVEYSERAIGIRARQTEVIIDRDEDDEAIIEDVIPDSMGDLCYEILQQGEESLWGFWVSHSLEREKLMRHKAPTGSPVGAAALEEASSS